MAGLMDFITNNFGGEAGSARLAGLGSILMAADRGRQADVSPYLGQINTANQRQQLGQSLQTDYADKFNDEERKFLLTLDPQTASSLVADRLFAKPEAPKYGFQQLADGTLMRTGSDGSITPVGNYAKPQEAGYQMLSPQEIAELGLPPGAYQRGADNRVSQIGGGGVNVNIDNGGKKFEEAFASGDAKTLSTVSDSGIAAQRNLGRLDRLGQLITASPSGAEAAVKQFLGERGIATDGLDNIQAAQALINAMVPEQRAPGSGPMSDADLALFKQSLPRLINTAGGNQMIMDTIRGINTYDAQGAQIVQQLRNGDIDRAQAFQLLQSRPNPLEGFKGAPTDAAAQATPQQSGVARISTDADYDALPSGASFIDPNGVTRRKP